MKVDETDENKAKWRIDEWWPMDEWVFWVEGKKNTMGDGGWRGADHDHHGKSVAGMIRVRDREKRGEGCGGFAEEKGVDEGGIDQDR